LGSNIEGLKNEYKFELEIRSSQIRTSFSNPSYNQGLCSYIVTGVERVALMQQAWLIQAIVIELRLTSLNRQRSHTERLMALFLDDSFHLQSATGNLLPSCFCCHYQPGWQCQCESANAQTRWGIFIGFNSRWLRGLHLSLVCLVAILLVGEHPLDCICCCLQLIRIVNRCQTVIMGVNTRWQSTIILWCTWRNLPSGWDVSDMLPPCLSAVNDISRKIEYNLMSSIFLNFPSVF